MYKIARILVLLGFTWRSLIILESFLIMFIVGSLSFLFFQNPSYSIIWFILIIPLIMLSIILLTLMNGRSHNFKELMGKAIREYEGEKCSSSSSVKKGTWQKINIIAACFGTFVGTGIVLVTLLIIWGMEDKIEIFFLLYCSIGMVLIFVIFWPFYSKRLPTGGSTHKIKPNKED